MTVDLYAEHGKAGTPVTETLVLDAHGHLGATPDGFTILDTSVESSIRVMDRLGIAMAAVSSLPACMGGVIRRGNDQIIDAVQRFPERIMGYISVNPRYPKEAAAELERCWNAGLRGIKVHSYQGTPYLHPSYEMVWEFAAAHHMPVLAHTWGQEVKEMETLFGRYPSVNWILAHGGSVDRESYVRAALTHANVFVDLVLSACPRGMIEYFVAQGLENKLLWGTDMVYMSAAPQLGRVLFAKITPQQKAKILGQNGKRALRLQP